MELYKQIRAADDPVVASASIALADNLRQQGKYKEALPILVSAQGSLTKCKDKRYAHSAATATNNLGAIYFWLGDYAKAEPLIESAYQMRRSVVSGNSDEIANSLGDLAAIYHKTGRYDKAESALHEALAIRQKSVGGAHRETALLLGNLGNLYAAQGKNDEAVKYYNQAIEVLKKAGLSQHPESGEYLEGLGLTLAKERQFDEALKLLRQSLVIRKKAFGLSNPDTAKSMVAIGKVLKWQQDALPEGRRDYREAGRYLRDGAARLKETLGADHPDYLSVGKFEPGD
ncbi:MAG: tetratricopeptide repeat protein [Candidatus Obscuribacter sp.]|nr:tetratricopeptide repeat protein [Candidatus Obscuribacter sp.]